VVESAPFARSPDDGETVSALIDLAGAVVPAGSRLRFDVGTTDPASLNLSVALSPTRFRSLVLDEISAQSDIDVSDSFAFEGSQPGDGLLVSSGVITLEIRNTLPIALDLDELHLDNESAFGGFPAGHVVASTTGGFIPANGAITITMPLTNEGLASQVRASATLSTPGSGLPVTLEATDGIFIDVSASLNIENVYVTPDADLYRSDGDIDFDTPEFTLEDPADYVELSSGTLEIREVVNGYSLN